MRSITILKGVIGGLYAIGTSIETSRLLYNRAHERKSGVIIPNSNGGTSVNLPVVANANPSQPTNVVSIDNGPALSVHAHGGYPRERRTHSEPTWDWPSQTTMAACWSVPWIGVTLWLMKDFMTISASAETRSMFLKTVETHIQLASSDAVSP